MKTPIKYIVTIKENERFHLAHTTCSKQFCASIDAIVGKNIYFRLHGSNALVIINHSWIECMAPAALLWEESCKHENN